MGNESTQKPSVKDALNNALDSAAQFGNVLADCVEESVGHAVSEVGAFAGRVSQRVTQQVDQIGSKFRQSVEKVKASELKTRVEALIQEGNVKKIVISDGEMFTLTISVTAALIAAAVLPKRYILVLAMLAGLASVTNLVTITVIRDQDATLGDFSQTGQGTSHPM